MNVSGFDARAAKLLKPGEYLAFDIHPGLRLEASQSRRAWIYRYKHPVTRLMKQTKLGLWPGMSYGDAVRAWEIARGQRSAGQDVGEEKRQKQAADKARAETAKRRETFTCAKVVDLYLTEIVEPARKTKGAAETRRMLERAVASVANLPADDLAPIRAHEIVLAIAATAPRVAAMTRQELRACWNHALAVGRITTPNPFIGRTVGGKLRTNSRDRVLRVDEIGPLLRWMREPRAYSRTVSDALELVLRTGLRSGEVCGIHDRELVERGDVLWLEIPGERMKAGRPHAVPLVGRAREIVELRRGGGFLFPRRDGKAGIEQKILGVEVYACSGRSTAKAYASRRVCPVTGWAPHDLRRTARTRLAELGCPFEVGEAIIAHALPGVAGVYNRAEFDSAKIEWLTKLGEHLDALADARNVVALPRKAA